MRLNVRLDTAAARATAFILLIGTCGCLLYAALCHFLVGALSDWRVAITPDASVTSFLTAAFT